MSVTREAVIHIGTEKTGSTSIQTCLERNKAVLAQRGIWVPGCLGLENHKLLATYSLRSNSKDVALTSQNIDTDHVTFRKNLTNSFTKELSNQNPELTIISSEDLHRLFHQDEVDRACDFLLSRFSRVRLIVFLRRQDLAAVSRHFMLLLAGKGERKVFPAQGESRLFYDYQLLLDRWSRNIGYENCIVIKYPERPKEECFDAVATFFQALGIDHSDLEKPRSENVSCDEINQIIIASLNNLHHDISKETKNDIIKRLLDYRETTGPYAPRKAAVEFLSQFESSNNALTTKFSTTGPFFSDDFSMYSEEGQVDRMRDLAIKRLLLVVSRNTGKT